MFTLFAYPRQAFMRSISARLADFSAAFSVMLLALVSAFLMVMASGQFLAVACRTGGLSMAGSRPETLPC